MVIENLAFVIGELRSENFAKNEEFSEIALQRRLGAGGGANMHENRRFEIAFGEREWKRKAGGFGPPVCWHEVKRDTLLHKLGAAHKKAGRAWSFVKITVPQARQPVNRDTFQFELLKDKLHDAQERDGHYLLGGFGAGDQAAPLWKGYMHPMISSISVGAGDGMFHEIRNPRLDASTELAEV